MCRILFVYSTSRISLLLRLHQPIQIYTTCLPINKIYDSLTVQKKKIFKDFEINAPKGRKGHDRITLEVFNKLDRKTLMMISLRVAGYVSLSWGSSNSRLFKFYLRVGGGRNTESTFYRKVSF